MIKTYNIKTHTEDWYKFRTIGIPDVYDGGIGASEIGNMLIPPKDQRPTLMELYHYKVGSETPDHQVNAAMFWGLELEETVADKWQYHDGTDFGYIQNKMAGNKKRIAIEAPGYLVNDKYPWLFCSLDRIIQKGQVMLIGGEKMDKDCPLECKTISSFHAGMWESGIPMPYTIQVNQQMLITETNYCEIAVLMDGRKFEVYPIQRSEIICKQIIEQSYEFWQVVLRARKAFKEKRLAEKRGDYETARQNEGIIQQLEPYPDSNEAYKDYFKEKYLKETVSVDGTDKDFDMARQLLVINSIAKELDKKKALIQNVLSYRFVETGAEKLSFGGSGYLAYNRWSNKIKPKPTDEFAIGEVGKLNLTGNYF